MVSNDSIVVSVDEERKPAWLRNLQISNVGLVDQGANERAHITLYKSQETYMTTTAPSQSTILKKRFVSEPPSISPR